MSDINKIVIERDVSGGKTVGYTWDTWAVNGDHMHGETTDLFSAVESLREFLKYCGHLPWDGKEHLSSVALLHGALGAIGTDV